MPPPPVVLRPVEFEILLSLAPGECHGYAIIQATAERTGGAVALETGTLYRALRRLLEAGLVAPVTRRPEPDEDERRRYYRLTPRGRAAAAAEAARLARLVDAARSARLLPAADRP